MSAPIGHIKALIWGVPFTFNGKKWTYPENFPACINEHVRRHFSSRGSDEVYMQETVDTVQFLFEHTRLKDLNEYKPWKYIDHHTPLKSRAKIILSETAGVENVNWWIVECIPDSAWEKPLPPGMVD